LGVAALAFLPPNIGATLCYVLALIPVLFLMLGSSVPQIIANGIVAVKKGSLATDDDADIKLELVSRHEAAHFCCGYWCGLPVMSYSIQQQADGIGSPRVEFGVAPQTSSSGFSSNEVAALAVTALSGLVAEASYHLKSENGPKASSSATQDLLELEQVFRRSEKFVTAANQQDLTRWGALTAMNLLRQYKDQYEQVVAAFQRQAPLKECIMILESGS
jgi:hypothetical protein